MQGHPWSVAILGVDENTIRLGVAAAGQNMRLTGLHDHNHHEALIASLRFGCNAYASVAEAVREANVVVCGANVGDDVGLPVGVLALRLRGGDCLCPAAGQVEARRFLDSVGFEAVQLRSIDD